MDFIIKAADIASYVVDSIQDRSSLNLLKNLLHWSYKYFYELFMNRMLKPFTLCALK